MESLLSPVPVFEEPVIRLFDQLIGAVIAPLASSCSIPRSGYPD